MVENPTYEALTLKLEALEKETLETRDSCRETRTASRNYKRFLRFLPYPVIVRDEQGLITYLNPAFTKTFGWTLRELKGKEGRQYVPPALKDELTSKIKALPSHTSVLELSTQRLTKDGRILDVMLRVGVDKDKDNNPEGMIIVLRDVTMENRIQRNRDVMARISQILPQYPELRKLLFYVNTQIKELLGTECANTILLDDTQTEFYFISAAHDDPVIRDRIEKARFPVDALLSGQVVKTGSPIIVNNFSENPNQYPLRDRKIGYTVKNAILVPLRNKDRIIGILAADNKRTGNFDDTDIETLNTIAATVALSIENARVSMELRNAYEELKSQSRAKDKMINHLSHELKTPVAILLTSFKILSKKMADLPEQTWKPTLARIYRNLNRIIGIEGEVYDIVEKKEVFHNQMFSLILEQCQDELEALIAEEIGEKGVLQKVRQRIEEIFSPRELEIQTIFLDQFVDSRISSIGPDMAHRDIDLQSRLEICPPIRMPFEPLRKTVDGLIRNAIENTPDGGKIEIGVHQKNNGVEFVVKDYGIGISKEAQKRIFEGFFSTQETLNYSSKLPYDFNAGGKGADLLRMKIFSERFDFSISMTSNRCSRIPEDKDACPGSKKDCNKYPGASCDGFTSVTCFFPISKIS